MYLVILIIDKNDNSRLIDSLSSSDIRLTKIASTGGFLNAGNTTLFIGVEEEKIPKVLHIVKTKCSRRESCEYVYYPSSYDPYIPIGNNNCIEIEIGGAIAFVIKVEQYFRI